MYNTLNIQRKALRVIFHTEFRADVRDKFIEYRLNITTTLYLHSDVKLSKKKNVFYCVFDSSWISTDLVK